MHTCTHNTCLCLATYYMIINYATITAILNVIKELVRYLLLSWFIYSPHYEFMALPAAYTSQIYFISCPVPDCPARARPLRRATTSWRQRWLSAWQYLTCIRELTILRNCVATNGNEPTRLPAGSSHDCEMSMSR